MKRVISPDTDEELQIPRKRPATSASEGESERARPGQQSIPETSTTDWGLWGPYLSERQWGTVREDTSRDGNCWESLSHDASSRTAYRSGEDGLLGVCDRDGLLCTAIALWNHRDPCLKERLFGLTNPQGNHGEDVKEIYYYLDNNPQHSYMRALYRYPQGLFPYKELTEEQGDVTQPEYELTDTGVFEEGCYWDVYMEYAKESPTHLVCCVTLQNRGAETAAITVLPHVWFRNTWSCHGNSTKQRPHMYLKEYGQVQTESSLGKYTVDFYKQEENLETILFTENETCPKEPIHQESSSSLRHYKDAFHRFIVQGESNAVNHRHKGTKCAATYRLTVPPGGERKVYWALRHSESSRCLELSHLENVIDNRKAETNKFYSKVLGEGWTGEERRIAGQAVAGLLWSKQFYMYNVDSALAEFHRLHNDQGQSPSREVEPPRNSRWKHLKNSDIIAVPDKWEFPWYAPWDLAFHAVSYTHLDAEFSKHQLELFLSDRYMTDDGQLPGCEFNLDDPNPPLHAWACLAVGQGRTGRGDSDFLARCFPKLTQNYEWWLRRLSSEGPTHLYTAGGFLGMDNISVFNRSEAPPSGYTLAQADGTAWIAMCALNMLDMSLQLVTSNPSVVSQLDSFLETFLRISMKMNKGCRQGGLWHSQDNFYYDVLTRNEEIIPVRVKSLVGLVSLFASSIIEIPDISHTASLRDRIEHCSQEEKQHMYKLSKDKYFLSLVPKSRLPMLMSDLCDDTLFLSPYGIRSLAKIYEREPYTLQIDKKSYTMTYAPGVSNSDMFGGNSNWRGPIWLCMNFLLMESIDRMGQAFGDQLSVEHPMVSGQQMPPSGVAADIASRIVSLFLPGRDGVRPCFGLKDKLHCQKGNQEMLMFHEFFDAETGRGCGASHQTGWTALVVEFLHRKYQ